MKTKEPPYTISEVAHMFSLHPDTLRNWERMGLITPNRIGPAQHRRYTKEHVKLIERKELAKVFNKNRRKKSSLCIKCREKLNHPSGLSCKCK